MRADAGDAGITQNLPEFGSFVLVKAAEAVLRVTGRGAEFDTLETGVRQLLERAGKIFGDHFAYRPCLASDGQAKGIGVEPKDPGGKQSSSSGLGGGDLAEFSSGDG